MLVACLAMSTAGPGATSATISVAPTTATVTNRQRHSNSLATVKGNQTYTAVKWSVKGNCRLNNPPTSITYDPR